MSPAGRTSTRPLKGFSEVAGAVLVGAVMSALLVAGVAKLMDLERFRLSLFTWRLLPDWLIELSWLVLPLAEAVLALFWLSGVRRKLMERLMLALLASVLAVIGLHWLHGERPTCNCLGVLSRYLSMQSDIKRLFIKTGVALGALLAGHALRPAADTSPGGVRDDPAVSFGSTTRRAFTLVECLVAVVVFVVLLALTFAGIAGARDSARRTRTLAFLQQHGGILGVYAADWQDSFPAFVSAQHPPYTFEAAGQTIEVPVYFAAPNVWHWALRDRYYADQPPDIFSDASDTGALPGGRGTFDMSCTLFAVPDFWGPETRLVGLSQLRGVRHADVVHASQKATLISQFPLFEIAARQGNVLPNPATLTVRVPTLAADGHAESVSARRFMPGVHMGDAVFDVSGITMHWQDILVGLHTSKGVRGTDWR